MMPRSLAMVAGLALVAGRIDPAEARPFSHEPFEEPAPAEDSDRGWAQPAEHAWTPPRRGPVPRRDRAAGADDAAWGERPARGPAAPRTATRKRHSSFFSRRRSLEPTPARQGGPGERPSWSRGSGPSGPDGEPPARRSLATAPESVLPDARGASDPAAADDPVSGEHRRHDREIEKLEYRLTEAEREDNPRKIKAINWLMAQENTRHEKELMKVERTSARPRLHAGPPADGPEPPPPGFSFHPATAPDEGRTGDFASGASEISNPLVEMGRRRSDPPPERSERYRRDFDAGFYAPEPGGAGREERPPGPRRAPPRRTSRFEPGGDKGLLFGETDRLW